MNCYWYIECCITFWRDMCWTTVFSLFRWCCFMLHCSAAWLCVNYYSFDCCWTHLWKKYCWSDCRPVVYSSSVVTGCVWHGVVSNTLLCRTPCWTLCGRATLLVFALDSAGASPLCTCWTLCGSDSTSVCLLDSLVYSTSVCLGLCGSQFTCEPLRLSLCQHLVLGYCAPYCQISLPR